MAYEALKGQLEERLATLRMRLSSLKKDAIQAHSVDSAEQAQERENDEVLDEIGKETALSIGTILAALARIENGTYGVCENCGDPIDQARLNVMPEAMRCVNCVR